METPTMKPAGYKPTKEEEYSYMTPSERAEKEEPKMKYAQVYVDDARMLPIDLSKYNAGDDFYLCVKVNLASKTSSENENQPKRESFSLEITGFSEMDAPEGSEKDNDGDEFNEPMGKDTGLNNLVKTQPSRFGVGAMSKY